MTFRDRIRRRPVAVYFALAFAVSWLGSLAVAGPKFFRGEVLTPPEWLPLGLANLAGPLLAGLAMTALTGGRAGLRDLAARLRRWRVGARWYTPLLIYPAVTLAVLGLLAVSVSPEYAPIFFAGGILLGLGAGFIEEVGWTGFAYPEMEARSSSPLAAALWLGLIHAMWQVGPDYLAASAARGEWWLPYILAFCAPIIPQRVLIVWLYRNTRSILLAQLMHASSTGSLVVLTFTLSPPRAVPFYWVYTAVLWLVVAVVLATHGKGLVRRAPGSAEVLPEVGQ